MTKDKTNIEEILQDLSLKSYVRGVSDEKFGEQKDGEELVDLHLKAIEDQVQAECEKYLDEFMEYCKKKELKSNGIAPMRSIFDFEIIYLDRFKKEQREHE